MFARPQRTRQPQPQPRTPTARPPPVPGPRPGGTAALLRLQARAGNQAVLGLLQRQARRGRKPKPAPPVENMALGEASAEGVDQELVDDLKTRLSAVFVDRVEGKKKKLTPARFVMRNEWKKAVALITQPAKLRKTPSRDDRMKGLYDAALADKLEALTPEQRAAVAAEVQRGLLEAMQAVPLDDLRAEYGRLSARVTDNLPGSFLGWVAMREGLLQLLGDIPTINAYFDAMVPADFPSANVRGHGTLVHKDFKDRLDRARKLLEDKKWIPLVERALSSDSVWSTNIRENSARPSDVGSHALGWAIDIAPGKNPDIRPFPSVFKDVIGADAGSGPEVTALRDPDVSTADAIKHSGELRGMSDRIVAAFADQQSILRAIGGFLEREGAGPLTADDRAALLGLLEAVAQAQEKKKAEAVDAVARWILARQDRVRDKANQWVPSEDDLPVKVQSHAVEDSLWVVEMRGQLGGLSASGAELDKRWALLEKQIDAPVTAAPREARQLGLAPAYTKKSVEALKKLDALGRYHTKVNLKAGLEQRMHRNLAGRTAGRVVDIYRVFLAAEPLRAKEPGSKATAGQVAAHGFLSLPPELVASLVSKEGGGLRWLGVMEGEKDSMHFELRPAERPALPKGTGEIEGAQEEVPSGHGP